MNDDSDDSKLPEGNPAKSKTQVKKAMLALQELGVAITKLSRAQQSRIPLGEELRRAIEQAPNIKSHSAKKRHMQYIGKLMRCAEVEKIQFAYQSVLEDAHRLTRRHHLVETWRDELLGNPQALEEFIRQFPQVDRQQLHHLIREARKEKKASRPPTQARKLFHLIRDTL